MSSFSGFHQSSPKTQIRSWKSNDKYYLGSHTILKGKVNLKVIKIKKNSGWKINHSTLPLNVDAGHLRFLMNCWRRERSSKLYSLSPFFPVRSWTRKPASTSYIGKDALSWPSYSCNNATHLPQTNIYGAHQTLKILLNVKESSQCHEVFLIIKLNQQC